MNFIHSKTKTNKQKQKQKTCAYQQSAFGVKGECARNWLAERRRWHPPAHNKQHEFITTYTTQITTNNAQQIILQPHTHNITYK